MVSRELLNLRNTIKRPIFVLSITNKSNTVKPVYNGHPWDPKIEAVVDRWPLFRGRLCYTICNQAFKMVAVI